MIYLFYTTHNVNCVILLVIFLRNSKRLFLKRISHRTLYKCLNSIKAFKRTQNQQKILLLVPVTKIALFEIERSQEHQMHESQHVYL
jgi:hypothetical protein